MARTPRTKPTKRRPNLTVTSTRERGKSDTVIPRKPVPEATHLQILESACAEPLCRDLPAGQRRVSGTSSVDGASTLIEGRGTSVARIEKCRSRERAHCE